MIQRPGELAGTAHVWVGEEGTGKNAMVEAIAALFHPAMVFTGEADKIIARFNALLRNRVFINIPGTATLTYTRAERPGVDGIES
jgi:hypothetical protein